MNTCIPESLSHINYNKHPGFQCHVRCQINSFYSQQSPKLERISQKYKLHAANSCRQSDKHIKQSMAMNFDRPLHD